MSERARIRLDKSCRDCVNFTQTSDSSGKCIAEYRDDDAIKLVDNIACFFFKARFGGV
jgi:recombinational DNA repair protein RecR